MNLLNRRQFVTSCTAAWGTIVCRTAQAAESPQAIDVLPPRARVPLSFVIDDSTCLVNMGHFCMPQFAAAWPERPIYKQPWHTWPREIPDAFVREFGEWCAEHGVKGKYSIVPYPACVGWLDRELPGWSARHLRESLTLVRELMVPHWDIHPEMMTHTRVIDLKTGRPLPETNSSTMENSYPQTDVSVDYLASYMAYALRVLQSCGLPCEGITTPGGFGNRVKAKLPQAVHEAVRDVFGCELPHYFKYVITGNESTQPQLEFAPGSTSVDNLTINVPAGTGDWFGGWEGIRTSEPDRYANEEATSGRMVDLIERGEPAVMLCHWPGMYCNGTQSGYRAFQRVVRSLARQYGERTQWMKLSEIGRYRAAQTLTKITKHDNQYEFKAPLACPQFTISLPRPPGATSALLRTSSTTIRFQSVSRQKYLQPFTQTGDNSWTLCWDLPQGNSRLEFVAS